MIIYLIIYVILAQRKNALVFNLEFKRFSLTVNQNHKMSKAIDDLIEFVHLVQNQNQEQVNKM